MKTKSTLVAILAVVSLGVATLGPADAQTRTKPAATGGSTVTRGTSSGTTTRKTPSSGALSTQARTPIDARTKAEVERRVTAAWKAMPRTQQMALAHSYWGLYQATKDPGPWPHVTPRPPVEPPATVPCVDCGKRQSYPTDPCAALRAELKEIMRQQILKGLIVNQLQTMLQALADMEFYGGVADLVGNVVSTTAGLVTAGAGGALGKAAVSALKDIATDQIQGAVMDALAGALPPPLDSAVSGNLTEAGLNGIVGALTAQISALNAQKVAKIKALNECAKNYGKELKAIDESNAQVVDCMKKTPNYCL